MLKNLLLVSVVTLSSILNLQFAHASWGKFEKRIADDYAVSLDSEGKQELLISLGASQITGQYFKDGALGKRVSDLLPSICVKDEQTIISSDTDLDETAHLKVQINDDIRKQMPQLKDADHLEIAIEIKTVFPTQSDSHFAKVSAVFANGTSQVLSNDSYYLDESVLLHPALPALGQEGKYFSQDQLRCK